MCCGSKTSTLLVICLMISIVLSSEQDHKYKVNDDLDVYVGKVGPYNNPREKYEFYKRLPFCPPNQATRPKLKSLAEALLGYEHVPSSWKIQFQVPVDNKVFCNHEILNEQDANNLKTAINDKYWFELFIDDLKAWGFLGVVENKRAMIYTHYIFQMQFNNDRVVGVKLEVGRTREVLEGHSLQLTYSVEWHESKIEFRDRFNTYLNNRFFINQVYWFSILNSILMVTFWIGVVCLIIFGIMGKDRHSENSKDEEYLGGLDLGSETGWKLVHGDVFRAPCHLTALSVCVGTGTQLGALVCLALLFPMGFYYQKGNIVTMATIFYGITSIINGYFSANTYIKNGGKRWIRTMLLTSSIFPGFIFAVFCLLNIVEWSYNSISTIPLSTLVIIFTLWGVVSFPLAFFGTILGRKSYPQAKFPCRINPVPRSIPEKPWYLKRITLSIIGGFLPFGSILAENFFVFAAIWQHKYYHAYGFLIVGFFVLLLVTVCCTVVYTYFLLNTEDYRWHWGPFLTTASTGSYIFIYAIYYFYKRIIVTGSLQVVYYFAYSIMLCVTLSLICGGVGFLGTQFFVHLAYRYIKVD